MMVRYKCYNRTIIKKNNIDGNKKIYIYNTEIEVIGKVYGRALNHNSKL